ncbi:hypothetical protein [Kitasatospora sp. NPDC001175]|uniref:hypothetical protein n=1 Tax=Kitasatospora sp. NPDC001175 TaxID=3157103 RepID=UPI003D092786
MTLTTALLLGWNSTVGSGIARAQQSPDAWTGQGRAVLPSGLTVELEFSPASGVSSTAAPGVLAARTPAGHGAARPGGSADDGRTAGCERASSAADARGYADGPRPRADRARRPKASPSADTGRESHPDTGRESHPDVGRELRPSAGRESHPDVGRESHPDTGRESHPDVGRELRPSAGRESHPDVGRESHPDVGRESHPSSNTGTAKEPSPVRSDASPGRSADAQLLPIVIPSEQAAPFAPSAPAAVLPKSAGAGGTSSAVPTAAVSPVASASAAPASSVASPAAGQSGGQSGAKAAAGEAPEQPEERPVRALAGPPDVPPALVTHRTSMDAWRSALCTALFFLIAVGLLVRRGLGRATGRRRQGW